MLREKRLKNIARLAPHTRSVQGTREKNRIAQISRRRSTDDTFLFDVTARAHRAKVVRYVYREKKGGNALSNSITGCAWQTKRLGPLNPSTNIWKANLSSKNEKLSRCRFDSFPAFFHELNPSLLRAASKVSAVSKLSLLITNLYSAMVHRQP